MKMIRLYVFDGPQSWIETTLERSLPDGLNIMGTGKAITVSTTILNEKVNDENAN